MFRKILVPLDGSPLSRRALEPAPALSQPTGAKLLLVRVPTADTFNLAGSEAQQRELAQDSLVYLELLRQSNEPLPLNIRAQVRNGDVGLVPSSTVLRSVSCSTDRCRVEPGHPTFLRRTPC